MKDKRWTVEQLDAINSKDCNLLLAASAGAGKTAVLVERIIRRVTDKDDPIEIDKLLVVTFTNAAASEMRERIYDALFKELEIEPHSKYLRKQLLLLGKASITTVHSFCLEVIKSYFHSIGIELDFRVGDETECTLLKAETVDELFEAQYAKSDEEFFNLLESFSGSKDDVRLKELVLDIMNFASSIPRAKEWLLKNAERFESIPEHGFSQTVWGKILFNDCRIIIENTLENYVRAVDIIKHDDTLSKYLQLFENESNMLQSILDIFSSKSFDCWDRLYDAIKSVEFARLPTIKGENKAKDQVKSIRDESKNRLKDLLQKTITNTQTALKKELTDLYPRIKHLVDMVIEGNELYSKKKQRGSILDFNDLEHFCLEILSQKNQEGEYQPTETAKRYQERFREIYVDEYQDSNLVQEYLITAVSRVERGEPNIFMVGDVKQSIYRFRNARPELFLQKYSTYAEEIKSKYRKILLYRNFRSRNSVISSINYIFKQIMSEKVGEVDYSDIEELIFGSALGESEKEDKTLMHKTELHLIDMYEEIIQDEGSEKSDLSEESTKDDNENDGSDVESEDEHIDDVRCEARLVGQRILNLFSQNENGDSFSVFDKETKENRQVQFRDIVVLMRTVRGWADVFEEEFKIMGIPAYADSGTGFFKTTEIQPIISLLQIIDNPFQDIPFLSVLRSQIGNFEIDDLTQLRISQRGMPIYEALLNASIEQGIIADKARTFLHLFNSWRQISIYIPVDKLIKRILDDTGYHDFLITLPNGIQRQANLRQLCAEAVEFEKSSLKGLFQFISFLNKLKVGSGDIGNAKILGENDDVVRIMSVHKSKGLEFPVCIISGCGKQFNKKDLSDSFIYHNTLGFGPDMVDCSTRLSWPSVAKNSLKSKLLAESISEEMRLLYVAMTRASEKLILTGKVKNISKKMPKWKLKAMHPAQKLAFFDMLSASNQLDWLLPALLKGEGGDIIDRVFALNLPKKNIDLKNSSFEISFWKRKDILSKNNFDIVGEKIESGEQYNSILSKDLELLGLHLSENKWTKIPAKITVTEAKRLFEEIRDEDTENLFSESKTVFLKKPKFIESNKALTPQEKGSALHFAMQHIDFTDDDVASQIEKMVEKKQLTLLKAQSIDITKINGFLASDLGKRVKSAQKVWKEIPFVVALPVQEIYKEVGNGLQNEKVMVQGVIDLVFEEAGSLVLLDYKSDYVPEGKHMEVAQRYKTQIELYSKALEILTGKIIKDRYIFLFWTLEAIKI